MSKLGTIYKIEYKDEGIIYIGSTLQKFNRRIQTHHKDYKRYLNGSRSNSISIYHYFQEFGIDNFKFEKIKEYNCCDKKHLLAYEQLYINKTDCVNIMNPFRIPYLSKKKAGHEYTTKNKQKLIEKRIKNKSNKKKYDEINKDRIKKVQKEYNIKNSKTIYCECGGQYTNRNKSTHFKTIKHQNFINNIS
jgi:predicted GIY-YIG superfamily endonuclease